MTTSNSTTLSCGGLGSPCRHLSHSATTPHADVLQKLSAVQTDGHMHTNPMAVAQHLSRTDAPMVLRTGAALHDWPCSVACPHQQQAHMMMCPAAVASDLTQGLSWTARTLAKTGCHSGTSMCGCLHLRKNGMSCAIRRRGTAHGTSPLPVAQKHWAGAALYCGCHSWCSLPPALTGPAHNPGP